MEFIETSDLFYPNACHVCKKFGKDTVKVCGGCIMISYCSKEHQIEDWQSHKIICQLIQNIVKVDESFLFAQTDNITDQDWLRIKLNAIDTVESKLGRSLTITEEHMFLLPRSCIVCHQRQELMNCNKCPSVSHCVRHMNEYTLIHTARMCAGMKLEIELEKIRYKVVSSQIPYLQRISNKSCFRNMTDVIDLITKKGNWNSSIFNVVALSFLLIRPFTLLNALQILDFNLKCEYLIIHVVHSDKAEILSIRGWEILLHLIPALVKLKVVLIVPSTDLNKCYLEPTCLVICDRCKSQGKELNLEYCYTLYTMYKYSANFTTPDIVIVFHSNIHFSQLEYVGVPWAPCIKFIADMKCPFILTNLMKELIEKEKQAISSILQKDVTCIFSGRNAFKSFAPIRSFLSEQVHSENDFMVIYKHL